MRSRTDWNLLKTSGLDKCEWRNTERLKRTFEVLQDGDPQLLIQPGKVTRRSKLWWGDSTGRSGWFLSCWNAAALSKLNFNSTIWVLYQKWKNSEITRGSDLNRLIWLTTGPHLQCSLELQGRFMAGRERSSQTPLVIDSCKNEHDSLIHRRFLTTQVRPVYTCPSACWVAGPGERQGRHKLPVGNMLQNKKKVENVTQCLQKVALCC